MLTIGVDAHKRTHVAVAVDAAGQECGQWQGPNRVLLGSEEVLYTGDAERHEGGSTCSAWGAVVSR
jgi:hypothetical protein